MHGRLELSIHLIRLILGGGQLVGSVVGRVERRGSIYDSELA